MTILELIKAQCKVQGVNDKYAERIEKISEITEEKDGNISAAVKNFKENVLPAISEAELGSKEAAKKAVEDYEKKHNLKDGKAVKAENTESEDNNLDIDLADMDEKTKKILQSQSKDISDLTKLVGELVRVNKKTSVLDIVREKLKGKIDEKFIDKYAKRVNLESEDIDAEIASVVKEFTDDKQAFLNEAVEKGNYVPVDGGTPISSDKEIDDYIEAKANPKASDGFAGIKI